MANSKINKGIILTLRFKIECYKNVLNNFPESEYAKIAELKLNPEKIDIIGPLGNGDNVDGDFNTALIVAGGLGIAPFPF